LRLTLLARTVSATEELAVGLQPMADDFAGTVSTNWGQDVNGTLKTVEDMRGASHHYFERLVVLVAASCQLTISQIDQLHPPG
jgi:hypothetical protein